jgi:hypothetical protein
MPIPERLSETMLEGTTGAYRFELVDEDDAGLDSAFVQSLTVTLSDADSGTIVNGRLAQDILNTNNGSLDTDLGPPVTTTVTLELQADDTVILNANRVLEYRILSFCWTWDGGTRIGRHVVQFGIENVALVS